MAVVAEALVALDEHDGAARAGKNLGDGEAGNAPANNGEVVASSAVKKLLKSEGRRLLDMRLGS